MATLAELLKLAPPGTGAFARVVKGGAAQLVMPGPAAKALSHSDAEMSITSVWTTKARDRQGDIVIPDGVDTAEHRINPVILYHHGKGPHLPIGKAEDPRGNYTGRVVGDRLIGTTYFAQGNQFAEDVYKLAKQDILRGMSIGFEPVEGHCKAIGSMPDDGGRPPLQFDRSTLIEVSHTPIGVNREALTMAVRKSYDGSAKLHPVLVEGLEPYALPRKPAVTVPAFPKQVNKAMADTISGAPEGVDDIDMATGDLAEGGGDETPTVAACYDAAQALHDIADRLEESAGQGEHKGGIKYLGKLCERIRGEGDDAKAMGDKIKGELGRGSDEPDPPEESAEPVGDPVEKAHDGRLVIKGGYAPRRWGPLDVARAEQQPAAPAVDLNADPDVIREEKAAEAAEARAERLRRLKRRNLERAGRA